MKSNRIHRLFVNIAAVACLGLATQAHAAPRYSAQMVRCSSTPWSSIGTCGGDPITTSSRIQITSGGAAAVSVQGAWPFNLYEVYWLPIGGTTADVVAIGNFATDCAGDARALLRTITTPAEIRTGVVGNVDTLVGPTSAGNFLVYSRGPWATDTDGDCRIDFFNTVPLGLVRTNPLANPVTDPAADPVQFLSGYAN